MLDNTNLQETKCNSFNLGQKLMLLMIGGGIGAGVALLFAPKSGRELRSGIADVASDGYARTVETANQLKARGADYYKSAKETGNEILDVVTSGLSVVGTELRTDAEKISGILVSKGNGSTRSQNIL